MSFLLGTEPVTLRRFTAGSRGTDGRFVRGSATDTTIQAAVQPLSERDLRSLPEGERQGDQRKVYTTTPLVVGRQGEATSSDRVSWDSGATWYEVRQADQHRAVLPHTRARVVRLDEGDS